MNKYCALVTLGVTTFGITSLLPTLAQAQQPAPPPAAPPPAAPPPAAAPAEAPAAEEPAPAPAPAPAEAAPTPPAAAAEEAAAPPAAEAAPVPPPAPAADAPAEEETFTVTTGVGFRAGARFQDLRDPEKMGMFSFDTVNVEPRFSGRVTKIVGWTANLTVEGRTATTLAGGAGAPPPVLGGPVVFEARAMDLIGQLDFMDEFHVWVGRMLTPSDRSNFSGPWFISPWEYPGVYNIPGQAFAYIGPRGTEEIGREVGTTVWGDIGKGKFKYYAAMLDVDDAPNTTPLYSGRLSYAIVGSEPGFYGSSTYYGAQDILAIGVAGQYQKRWSPAGVGRSGEVGEFNADILAEFNLGDSGTLTGEGAFYHFTDPGGLIPSDNAFFVVTSYLFPSEMGIGKLQPIFRYQASYDDDSQDMSMIEAQVAYVMKDYFAKLVVGYEHTKVEPAGGDAMTGNAIRLGFQVQQ